MPTMPEIYARLAEVNTIIGDKKTDLATVYALLKECDEIIKTLIEPSYQSSISSSMASLSV
jgi:hypothetical protein